MRGRRPATSEEIDLARASITRGYPRGFETAQQVARGVAQLALHGLPDSYFEEFVPRVEIGHRGRREPCRVADTSTLRAWSTLVVGDYDRVAPSLGVLAGRADGVECRMKAVRFHEHGEADVLRYEDAPVPERRGRRRARPRARLRAQSSRPLEPPRHRARDVSVSSHLGADVAGEVASSLRQQLAPGRRVMLQPGAVVRPLRACLDGRDNDCPRYDVLGSQSDGGYAEFVRVPLQNLIPLPDAIGFVEAAAFPLTFLTAWHMLVTRADMRAGEDVLVLGAGSGVGQAAIQIAWLHGARVFATAGTDEKLARAREIGAYEVVNHHTQDIAVEIRRLTGNRGVDIVFEHVGTATWDRSLKCLAAAAGW